MDIFGSEDFEATKKHGKVKGFWKSQDLGKGAGADGREVLKPVYNKAVGGGFKDFF